MMSSMMTLILKHQGYFTLMTFADFLLHLKIANDSVHCKKIAHDEHNLYFGMICYATFKKTCIYDMNYELRKIA